MDDKKFWVIPSVAVFLGLVAVAVAIATAQPSSVTTNVGGDTNPAPVVMSGNDGQYGATLQERETDWDAGRFTGPLTLESSLHVSGTASFTGSVNFTGQINSTSVGRLYTQAWTGSATNQALCSIQNTTGRTITLDGVFLQYATNTATGGVASEYSISIASAAATTGTGANLLTYATFAVPSSGLTLVTPTSTLRNATTTNTGNTMSGIPQTLRPGYYVNFMTGNPTTTFSGTCQVAFF